MMRGIEQYLQVDAATLGALKYQGVWNASTNTPTLTSGVGVQGQYYVVSVAGTTNLDGETNWGVGDWAVFNGTVWQKVDGGSTGNLTTLTVTGNTYLATTSGRVGVATSSPSTTFQVGDGTGLRQSHISGAGYDLTLGASGGNFMGFASGAISLVFNSAAVPLGIGTNAAQPLIFGTAFTERMRIDSAGNVGIGVTPSSLFNVYSATNATATIQGDSTSLLAIERYSTDITPPNFALRKFRGTLAAKTAVASGDTLGNINFTAYGGTNQRIVAQVRSFVDTYVSDTDISSYLVFGTSAAGTAAATERMRIDQAGNVGIGVTPTYKLDVAGGIRTNVTTGGFIDVAFNGTVKGNLSADTNNFYVNTQNVPTVMNLNGGNVGIGVTPSAWGAAIKALEQGFGSTGGVAVSSTGSTADFSQNTYNNGTNWIYKTTNNASFYRQQAGQHFWFNAPSGTAGNAITFTQAMTLDASGNLSIGTAALATTATNGFLYIPTCAGIPTGVPTAKTGLVPMVYDSTNNKFYIYNGAWKSVALL